MTAHELNADRYYDEFKSQTKPTVIKCTITGPNRLTESDALCQHYADKGFLACQRLEESQMIVIALSDQEFYPKELLKELAHFLSTSK